MSTIREIEDKMVEALELTGSFDSVTSVSKKAKPLSSIQESSAFVFWIRDAITSEVTRPTYKNAFICEIQYKLNENENDTYYLIDKARDAIQGSKLGLLDIKPFICEDRQWVGFENGIMQYHLVFTCISYLAIPAEWRR